MAHGYTQQLPSNSRSERLPERLNSRFYKNEISSQPHDMKIEEILDYWHGDYDTLETKHGFIQWLFPTRERGLNSQAMPLDYQEIEEITTDDNAVSRFERAVELMLDFYGFKVDRNSHPLTIEASDNCHTRFDNMIRYSHNNLRITRILNCLREFSRFDFQEAFIRALAKEIYSTRNLHPCERSFEQYWLGTIYDEGVKKNVTDDIDSYLVMRQDKTKEFSGKNKSSSDKKASTGKGKITIV